MRQVFLNLTPISNSDTFSSAPSEVPDFLDGPDRFGDNVLVPVFRTYVARYFGGTVLTTLRDGRQFAHLISSTAPKENVAENVIPLPRPPEESHEMDEADIGTTHDVAGGGSGETVGVTTPSGVSFVITPAPQDWTVPSREIEKIKSKIKEFISASYSECEWDIVREP